MVRLPFHERILLITTGGMFLCKVEKAKDEFIIAYDVQLRFLGPRGDILVTTKELGGKFCFDRKAIVGYSSLEKDCDEKEQDNYRKTIVGQYNDNIAINKRSGFKLINLQSCITQSVEISEDQINEGDHNDETENKITP